MEAKSFGALARLILPAPLGVKCEVMRFEHEGIDHTHGTDEIAIAVSGYGVVVVEGDHHPIIAGQFIRIPAGKRHHMVPGDGVSLAMLIGYCDTTR